MTNNASDIARLQQRREELKSRLQAIQRDLGRGLEKDFEEQAIQLENLEVLEEIARVAKSELREVELQIAQLQAEDKEDS